MILKASKVQFDLVSAHPKANGFYRARFPLGGIPYAYSLISQQFFNSANKVNLVIGWTWNCIQKNKGNIVSLVSIDIRIAIAIKKARPISKFKEAETASRIRLFEYWRPKWTFHAKGLWYYLPESAYPIATMVGSANYGYRSVEKDLEAQFTIVTRNEHLQKALHEESQRLFKHSEADIGTNSNHLRLWKKEHFPKNPLGVGSGFQ